MKLILTIILYVSFINFALSQNEKKSFNPYDITLKFNPLSIVNNEFGAIDFSVEFGLTPNTFLANNNDPSWGIKQLSSTSFQIRSGYFINTSYQHSHKHKKGFLIRFQVRKYFFKTMHSINGKRELAGLYLANEIFFSKQNYLQQEKVIDANTIFNDTITEADIYDMSINKYLGFEKTNFGGYINIGFQHQIKHFVIDYYIGLGNKYMIIKKNRTDNFDKKIVNFRKCGVTSILPFKYFLETGFSLGIR